MKQERAAPGSAGTIGSALQRVQCWEVKNKSIYKNCMGWGQEGDILPVPGEQELRPSRPGVGYADVCLLVGGKGGGVCGSIAYLRLRGALAHDAYVSIGRLRAVVPPG